VIIPTFARLLGNMSDYQLWQSQKSRPSRPSPPLAVFRLACKASLSLFIFLLASLTLQFANTYPQTLSQPHASCAPRPAPTALNHSQKQRSSTRFPRTYPTEKFKSARIPSAACRNFIRLTSAQPPVARTDAEPTTASHKRNLLCSFSANCAYILDPTSHTSLTREYMQFSPKYRGRPFWVIRLGS
jgi:hypothetical protein